MMTMGMLVLAFGLPLLLAVGAYLTTRSVVNETHAALSRVAGLRRELKDNRKKLQKFESEMRAEENISNFIKRAYIRKPSPSEELSGSSAVPPIVAIQVFSLKELDMIEELERLQVGSLRIARISDLLARHTRGAHVIYRNPTENMNVQVGTPRSHPAVKPA